MKRFFCLLAILGWLCMMAPAQLAAGTVAQIPIDHRFGAIESFWAPNEAAALRVGWERILFYWSEIQPTGPADWNTLHVLEEWLTEANAQGRTVVGLLKNTPPWATDGIPFAGVPRGLYLPIDDPGNLWANYVRQVANYYGPRGVHHWIVWNEPDIAPNVYGHEFAGSVEEYYQLLKVAYQVMKQVDPNATIHLAGLTHWHDPGYLRRFLRVATADPEAPANNHFFDVISLHIYFRVETVQSIVATTWAVQSEFGLSKPVWVNETNAAPNLDPDWPVNRPQFQIDLEQQAWYIVQAHALGFAAGAARIGVYKLIDIQLPPGGESFGVLRPDFSQRPAYFSYQNTIKYLSGFTYPVQKQQLANYFIVAFSKPDGLVRVLWARNPAAVMVDVPALKETALLVTALGEVQEITAANGTYRIQLEGARCRGECLMGGPPLFLVEEGVVAATLPAAPAATPNVPTATVTAAITATATATSEITATVTISLPTAAASISPTEMTTATATATGTATGTPTHTPTPTAVNTATPATTKMPTMTPFPSVVATEVALVVETAVPTAQPASTLPAPGIDRIPTDQASWWFLGAGGVVGVVLFLFVRLQRGRR